MAEIGQFDTLQGGCEFLGPNGLFLELGEDPKHFVDLSKYITKLGFLLIAQYCLLHTCPVAWVD